VDDEATGALMAALYRRWNPKDGSPGTSLARALREAQDEVRSVERWSHPTYWAGWSLWGVGG
jgi:CHAT domain-containing protein